MLKIILKGTNIWILKKEQGTMKKKSGRFKRKPKTKQNKTHISVDGFKTTKQRANKLEKKSKKVCGMQPVNK